MSATRIDGKAVAAATLDEVATRVAKCKEGGVQPCLAVLLVGDNPASQIYVRNKEKRAAEVGIETRDFRIPGEEATTESLLKLVGELGDDPAVHGILVQLPLPDHIDADSILAAVPPSKDVDGFHPDNLGRLVTGDPRFVACTPQGCMLLLEHTGVDLTGKRALVIGRSTIVGKPMAQLLLAANATVTVAHSRTQDLAAECKRADVVVAAVGRAKMVKGDWVKPGAVVIDVGMNRDENKKLCGDVDYAEVSEHAAAITPVPGGVGPMTIACLLRNVVLSAEQSSN